MLDLAPTADQVARLRDLLAGRHWVALTGAGISTDSGIPDYRGPQARPTNPMQYREFVGEPASRRRYWVRSMMGHRSFGRALPNPGHLALARLAVPVLTQNVDGLHTDAGSARVIDLHGRISRVVCLDCGDLTDRDDLQVRLEDANPGVVGQIPAGHAELRPDGDAEVAERDDFVVPPCLACGGMLKPDVVFFGESVPRPIVDQAWAMVDAAEVLVVAGSSLTVMSGLRFARAQAKRGRPLVIVNHGVTRADELATLRIDAGTSPTLVALAEAVDPHPIDQGGFDAPRRHL
ncbi:Sir2 family NAD-dependent protein deacetylase [Aestuariimicrobium ganziense]|uniref:Sir2 family NAD-dependent protein deacetylase n=1 Tax=Aestuariimicrobium ganziense TaxID=2773677 RepID=UPI001941D509|nr:Sir2 family NAD-dependent protein deacetylase [Aestuariimicrobium ganziense]